VSVVVVEGMDFSGKSTVCRLLRERLAGHGLAVTASQTSLARGVMPALIEAVYRVPLLPPLARSLAFHAAYLPDLRAALPGGRRVLLQESYICRVLAYDQARGRPMLTWCARHLAVRLHRRVDLAVLLECPYEERRARCQAAGTANRRDVVRFSASCRLFEERLSRHLSLAARAAGYAVVDTAAQEAHQVAAEITALVLALPGQRG
jgi:thymidylate kinase